MNKDIIIERQANENLKLVNDNKDLQERIDKLKQCYCNRTDCGARIKDSKKYDSLQQRIDKAIEYLNEYENIKAHKLELNEDGFKDIIDFGFKENMLSILRGE